MVQGVKVLAIKPDDLWSIAGPTPWKKQAACSELPSEPYPQSPVHLALNF